MYKNASEYYRRIADVVVDLFDRKWEQFVIRICKDELHSTSGVYCKINNEFKLIGEYISTGELNMVEYINITCALGDIANEMQEELYKQGQEVWKCMVFTLMKGGKFDVEYSYDDIAENFVREEDIWKYKRLGIVPDEDTMKYIVAHNI